MDADDELERMKGEVERLRKLAHDAPLAKLGQRHTGERFIQEHTNAWALRSHEYMEAKAKLDAILARASSADRSHQMKMEE